MEVFLAMLIALGIFIVAPALLAAGIVGVAVLRYRVRTAQARRQLTRAVATRRDGGVSFTDEVCAVPGGEGIRTCIQCGVCTGSCPNANLMDYPPRKIIAMVRAGMEKEVLSSNSMWYCLSCYLCTVRCPRGIKPTDVMYALKQVAMEHGFGYGPTDAPIMYRTFVDAINGDGRVHEFGMMRKFYLRTNPFKALGMLPVGLALLRRGRMPLRSERMKGAAEVQTIIEKARMMERAPLRMAERPEVVEAAQPSLAQSSEVRQ